MRVGPSREGATELSLPESASHRGPGRRAPVFYNAALRLDRDVAVSLVRAWSERRAGRALLGWEMLSATGVRGLRLLHETAVFSELWLTELGAAAHAVLEANAQPYARAGARVARVDARRPIAEGRFDFVDLDPYGSPLPFVGSAFASLRDGGLLAVSATDMRVLAGVEPGVAERRYGGRPVRGRWGPEAGLRLLLASLYRTAQEGRRTFRPLLSYVRDHHVRTYIEVGGPEAAAGGDPVGMIPSKEWEGPPVRGKGPYGPLWLGPLFDRDLVAALAVPASAECPEELARLLARWREESQVDRPFYYEPNEVARDLGLAAPPPLEAFRLGLGSLGYRFARTHARPSAFRTDAPPGVVRRVAREGAEEPAHSQNARVRA